MENGAVQIYYGEGHGKTNVAIGSAICAACDGKQAVVIQFLKGKKEPEFLKKLEPEVKFFNFSRAGILFEQLDEESKQEEIMNIKNGFNYAMQRRLYQQVLTWLLCLMRCWGFWICI